MQVDEMQKSLDTNQEFTKNLNITRNKSQATGKKNYLLIKNSSSDSLGPYDIGNSFSKVDEYKMKLPNNSISSLQGAISTVNSLIDQREEVDIRSNHSKQNSDIERNDNNMNNRNEFTQVSVDSISNNSNNLQALHIVSPSQESYNKRKLAKNQENNIRIINMERSLLDEDYQSLQDELEELDSVINTYSDQLKLCKSMNGMLQRENKELRQNQHKMEEMQQKMTYLLQRENHELRVRINELEDEVTRVKKRGVRFNYNPCSLKKCS